MLTELLQVQIKDKREYIQIKMLYLVDRAFFSYLIWLKMVKK